MGAEQFGRAGIPFFMIKGSILAEHIYRDPSLRRFSDLDLVVHRDTLARAEELLRSLGYRLGQVDILLNPPPKGPTQWRAAEALTRRFYERFEYELPFYAPPGGELLPVDLHWHVAPGFRLHTSAAQLWEQTVAVTVAGISTAAKQEFRGGALPNGNLVTRASGPWRHGCSVSEYAASAARKKRSTIGQVCYYSGSFSSKICRNKASPFRSGISNGDKPALFRYLGSAPYFSNKRTSS